MMRAIRIVTCSIAWSVLLLSSQATAEEECIKWGENPDNGPRQSKNVVLNCERAGKPVCCQALNTTVIPKHRHRSMGGACKVTRTYESSPYELMHRAKADEWARIRNDEERKQVMQKFRDSDEQTIATSIWLDRVTVRMLEDDPVPTKEDFEYLSRWKVHRQCKGGTPSSDSIEWIEPLTIHGRYPATYCQAEVGHILIQNYKSYRQTIPSSHHDNKVFVLDAGSQFYDSSPWWFACGYTQKGFTLDNFLAWEYTLLDPKVYWKAVPEIWKPIWRFFNVPISIGSTDNPLHFIKSLATVDDFVAFKLDVDNHDIEIPMALFLSQNAELLSLIDEFFFELHYHCEFECGCSLTIPKEMHGMKLTIPHVLDFFKSLRENGVRSHFWP